MSDSFLLQLSNNILDDFYTCFCGLEECIPSHSFGPSVRPTYILHYILSGKGSYYVNNKKYDLSTGQGFLIYPNELTFYQADKNDPWTYLWIGFNGTNVDTYLRYAGLGNSYIFECTKNDILKDYIVDMLKLNTATPANELKIQGLLFMFFSCIAEYNKTTYKKNDNNNNENMYISKAIEFISRNYHNTIKVSDIARYLCLNRTYLTALFNKHIGMSPQSFLLNFRIDKGKELLQSTVLPIGDIARSCGYSDPLSFSKTFKKVIGYTPSEFRIIKPVLDENLLLK